MKGPFMKNRDNKKGSKRAERATENDGRFSYHRVDKLVKRDQSIIREKINNKNNNNQKGENANKSVRKYP